MGSQQSKTLQQLTAAGPWNSSHPLPSPWSEATLQATTKVVLKGMLAIVGFSFAAMVGMFFYLRFSSQRRVNVNWQALSHPTTTRSQMLILICHLVLAQVLQLIGYLISAIHLIKGQIISPSPTCQAQGIFLFGSHTLTHFTIANIATHSAYCVSRLKPMSLNLFVMLNIVTWMLTLTLCFVYPLVYHSLNEVPFFTFSSIVCFVSGLWRIEKIIVVYVPSVALLSVGIFLYPFISVKLVRHSARLRRIGPNTEAAVGRERDILRASKRVLMFPIATVIVTLPFLTLSMMGLLTPLSFKAESWTVIMVGYSAASAPLVTCVIYFFLTSFFKPSATPENSQSSAADVTGSEMNMDEVPFILGEGTVKTFISSPAARESLSDYDYDSTAVYHLSKIRTVDFQPGSALPKPIPK
ncbi:hypothetical protein BCR37DRAFT_261618 [Protomyces lactucae-debilis]|uniref:G-protein coupled receptors family 1 profile domain-containing protein n=1 Tax=Protomyces lactucae-debilis TaxID=2754530 RepID=A0A1Y2FJY7_PROLT|nr:uncharacterized protein BCR37DRAFT_261618 [Protomyces lactucae-debilis]ORY84249.1 hypothetical protein BCR37DRAFT_261618 [Protomyces lactucae-debilis]